VDGKPFAIIQRWLIADNNDLDKAGTPTSKPMLAVTRLPPGPVCHVRLYRRPGQPRCQRACTPGGGRICA
jgi:hypothetical protein